ncbi:MAG: hypothetical protein ACOC2H_01935 [Spirochaetota bacterium]
MKHTALLFFIVTALPVLAQPEYRLGVYMGQTSSTIDCGSNYSTDNSLFAGLSAYAVPYPVLELSNNLHHAPDIHRGHITDNTLLVTVYPHSFDFGRPFVGGGLNLRVSQTETDSFTTRQSRHLPYGRIGHTFEFDGETVIGLVPWSGYGRETAYIESESRTSSRSDVDADRDSSVLLNGLSVRFAYEDFFTTDFSYAFHYYFLDKQGFSNVSASVTTTLHNNFGISYRFQYIRDTGNEDILNSIGLTYKM